MKYFVFWMNLPTYGQIPDFNKKISTVRSRGIALIPILQNLRAISKSLS